MSGPMETEAIDKLFLELSQFTKARTARELTLMRRVAELTGGPEVTLFKDCVYCSPDAGACIGHTKREMEFHTALRKCHSVLVRSGDCRAGHTCAACKVLG